MLNTSCRLAMGVFAAASLTAAAAGAQDRVLRVLSAADSQPLAYAFVQANGGHALLTDEDGRVSLGAGKRQTYTIEVRRIGYAPFYGKMDLPDTAVTMTVLLHAVAQELGSVRVTANKSKSSLELSGFYRRWLEGQKGANSATFIGPEEIEKRNATRVSTLLSGVGGINLSRTPNGNSVVMAGGGQCPMAVVIDGRQLCGNGGCLRDDPTKMGLTDQNAVLIDQVIDINSVAGVEVYKRGGNIPSDFHINGDCGAVVLWTGTRKR